MSDSVEELGRCAAGAVDWERALAAYSWNGDWRSGLSARRQMANDLRSARTPEEKAQAIDQITLWGGVPLLRGTDSDRTIASLEVLTGAVDLPPTGPNVYGRRIASVSKVYAMHDLDRWVIYDSRVAWALAWMTDALLGGAPDLPIFYQPPARTAPAYPGVPSVRSERHGRDSFLIASGLARSIAKAIELPRPETSGWRAVHVEMALFTIGGKQNRQEDWMAAPSTSRRAKRATSGRAVVGKLAQDVLPTGALRDHSEQMILTWVEKFRAKMHASNYAYQTDSQAALVQFPDGGQRWVVFRDREPIATFPNFLGDVDEALRFHNFDRLKLQTPKELDSELAEEREHRKKRWKIWARDASSTEQEEVASLLQLEPGEIPAG